MSDFGSTTLGYAIAYLLPGLTASVGAGLLSNNVEILFVKVIDEQNLPLGLMGALGALALGVFLSLFRALIFEEWLWRKQRLSADDYATLADDDQTFKAYHRMIDEVYRFHQFWGGMALALPIVVIGAVAHDAIGATERFASIAGAILFEGAAIWAAVATYKRYLIRVKRVLETG